MSVQTVQWAALVLCLVGAGLRLPDAVRGQGRSVFTALVLLSVAVALSLPPIYLTVDSALGRENLANLVIRLSLYAVTILLGLRMAAAFGCRRARSRLVGPVGRTVLVIAVACTVVLFLLSDLRGSSTGLAAFKDQQEVQLYAAVGRLYPGYVAACLVLPAVAAARNRSFRGIHRVACLLLGLGFALIVAFAAVRVFVESSVLGPLDVLLPFAAILLVVSGLTLIWFSKRRLRTRKHSRLPR